MTSLKNSQFKVDDKVRYVKANIDFPIYNQLQKGEIYTVEDVITILGSNFLLLKELPQYMVFPEDFEPAYLKDFSDKLKDLTDDEL